MCSMSDFICCTHKICFFFQFHQWREYINNIVTSTAKQHYIDNSQFTAFYDDSKVQWRHRIVWSHPAICNAATTSLRVIALIELNKRTSGMEMVVHSQLFTISIYAATVRLEDDLWERQNQLVLHDVFVRRLSHVLQL